ncbi:MAG: YveK family protein [Lachnospiraceae bacterium]
MGTNQQNEEMEIDLLEIFYVLLSKIWIIILATALGFGVAAGYTIGFVDPIYSSTSTIYVMTKSTSLTSLADLQVGSSLTKDYQVFIKSRPVVDRVIEELELDMTYEEFVNSVTIDNPQDTRFINITVNHTDAYIAKKIVDKLTDVAVSRMEEIMETEAPNVADYGHVAEQKTSPSTAKNAIMGALVGFVLSAGIIVVMFLLDDSIQTSEDVEKYIGINTLGIIPLEEGTSKKDTRGHDKDMMAKRKKQKKDSKKNK